MLDTCNFRARKWHLNLFSSMAKKLLKLGLWPIAYTGLVIWQVFGRNKLGTGIKLAMLWVCIDNIIIKTRNIIKALDEKLINTFWFFRHQGFPRQGDNTLGRIDVFMLLDLLGANNPEPTILSGHQATHVSSPTL